MAVREDFTTGNGLDEYEAEAPDLEWDGERMVLVRADADGNDEAGGETIQAVSEECESGAVAGADVDVREVIGQETPDVPEWVEGDERVQVAAWMRAECAAEYEAALLVSARSESAERLLGALYWRQSVSYDELQEIMGVGHRQMRSYVSELEEAGVVELVREPEFVGSVFVLVRSELVRLCIGEVLK